jgi:type II secretory pathway component PulC
MTELFYYVILTQVRILQKTLDSAVKPRNDKSY